MTTISVCQSCAMPMASAGDFGTNPGGSQNEEFCTYCVQEGSFTDHDATIESMVDVVAGFSELPEAEAKKVAFKSLIGLKRWQGN